MYSLVNDKHRFTCVHVTNATIQTDVFLIKYMYVLKILILIEIRGIVMIWNDYDVKLGL